jgi:hypothetical protein
MIDRVGQFLVNNGVVDEAAILEAFTIQKKEVEKLLVIQKLN